ncbi:hypothetical protein EZL74_12630 [Flavobacterium silvisoli]|uniref:Uncharacterized protein n=1 Tax=Flavobacterium silvisoli TaxID=2529433 RepID=A0A4V2L427_9FLAO|nr:hypothetical protein [Flavobacterium silvisoli]TBX64992.1 hypothetical protein EZL74_12630 [Flavobacterium silvisoli]
MNRFFFALTFFFFFISNTFSQTLVYKSNGRVYNIGREKLTPKEVREILSVDKKNLDLYNSGRSKKTIGNVLMVSGLGLMSVDLINGAMNTSETNSHPYPSALTFVGAAFIVASIPIKIGFSKKVKTAVDGFNKLSPNGNTADISNNKELEFIANTHGLGFRLTLN